MTASESREVALFVSCVVDLVEPAVGEAAVRVLRAAGCQVSCPEGQTCCGQPAWNSGFAPEAARVARTTLAALETVPEDATIVCPAGSCSTMIRVFWPELFELVGDAGAAQRARSVGARTRELCEFLAEVDLPPLRLPVPRTVAYHHSCHMLRELRLRDAPLQLLAQVQGCSVAEWSADERCCGFGGLFSTKLPETSVAMADDKLSSIPPEVSLLVGADTSCLLHLRGRAARTGSPGSDAVHVAELLADALAAEDTPP